MLFSSCKMHHQTGASLSLRHASAASCMHGAARLLPGADAGLPRRLSVPVVSAISWPTCFWEVRPLLVVADVRVLVLLDLLQLSATRSVTHMELQTSHLVDAKWIASRTHRDSAAFTPLCSIMQAASVSTFCISARQCVASGCLALADGCHELASMAGGTRSTAA